MPITRISGEQSFGGRIGEAVGGGISGLIDNLVMKKAKELEQRNNAKGYEQGWNLTPEQSKFIASQSPEFQQDFVKALHAQQQSEAFQRAIGGGEQQQPSLAQNMGNMIQPQQPSLQDNIGGMGGQQVPQDAILMALQKGLGGQNQGQPAILPQQPAVQSGPQEQQPQPPQPKGKSIADILGNAPLNPNLQAKAEELNERKRGNAFKEQLLSYKQVGKELNKLHDKAERGRRDKAELLRAKKYNDSGKLIQGKNRQILEAVGLQDFFTNEPTQVVDKIIARLESGVSEAYGTGRPTNFLADNYKRQLPKLINTKEGFNAISDNLIDEIDALEIVDKKARDIETSYNKAKLPIPFDVIAQAREEARPELDKLEERSSKRLDDAIGKIDKNGSQRGFSTVPKVSDYNSNKPLFDTKTKTVGTVVDGVWKWRKATADELKRAGV